MLHILLVILKIIGILLAVILGLFLLVVFLVLFVPLHYRLKGRRYPDEMQGVIKISWLLHLITVTGEYRDDQLQVMLRIFGFPRKLYPFVDKSSEDIPVTREIPVKPDIGTDEQLPSADVTAMSKKVPPETELPPPRKTEVLKQPKQQAQPRRSKLHKLIERLKDIWNRIRTSVKKLSDFKDLVIEKIALLRSEMTKSVWRRCKGYLFYLLKHFRPRKVRGILRFGFEDPALTGLAAGGIYVILPPACYSVEIQPDFEQPCLEGDLFIKGRIRMIHLGKIAIKLFFDKELKKLIKSIKM